MDKRGKRAPGRSIRLRIFLNLRFVHGLDAKLESHQDRRSRNNCDYFPEDSVADIGIAIGSGSDVAKEAGGIILIKNDVRDVVAGIRLSRATMRKIKQNLFRAFIYNTLGIPIVAWDISIPLLRPQRWH